MKEINIDWWSSRLIKFQVSMNGPANSKYPHSTHYWGCTRPEAIWIFVSLFSEEDFRSLNRANKGECAEFAKAIIGAYASHDLDLQVALSAFSIISSYTMMRWHDFVTVRSVGKKLFELWEKVNQRNSFDFISVRDRVLASHFYDNADTDEDSIPKCIADFLRDNQDFIKREVREFNDDFLPENFINFYK